MINLFNNSFLDDNVIYILSFLDECNLGKIREVNSRYRTLSDRTLEIYSPLAYRVQKSYINLRPLVIVEMKNKKNTWTSKAANLINDKIGSFRLTEYIFPLIMTEQIIHYRLQGIIRNPSNFNQVMKRHTTDYIIQLIGSQNEQFNEQLIAYLTSSKLYNESKSKPVYLKTKALSVFIMTLI